MERYVKLCKPKLDLVEMLRKFAVTEDDDVALVQDMRREALAAARPKALYKVCYVENIAGDETVIDGNTFTSRILARNLSGIHRVYAYVVTCGQEIDAWARGDADFVMSVWKDMVKEMVLKAAVADFNRYLKAKYKTPGLSGMNPGSGNADTWPIAQQKNLFALLGGARDVGVTLTDSCLMIPDKSVSGILFASDKTYVNCAVCRRERCPDRRVPYDPETDV